MTTLAPPEAAEERPVPARGGVRRWWRSWRTSLRIARRDAWRHKGQSLLVVTLIFAPVVVLTALDVYYRTTEVAGSYTYQALLRLGRDADARVTTAYDAPVVQDLAATSVAPAASLTDENDSEYIGGTDRQRPPRFPAGWHTVQLWFPPATVTVGARAWGAEAVVTDTRDPLAAGTYDLSAGHLPNGPGEIAVSRALADAAGLTPGSTLTLSTDGKQSRSTLTVVGIADVMNRAYATSVVLQPGQLPTIDSETAWLADTPEPLSWQDVRALNATGLAIASRAVLTEPPDFCRPWQLCLDDGPVDRFGETGAGGLPNASDIAAGALVAVLALLQVALLAGPAFAVSLRRRQRDLALIGANGGTGADLRRTILSSAVVLGVVAGAAAVAAALLGVRLASPWLARWGGDTPLPAPVLRPEVVGLAAVAVLAALCAAFVPARIAARTDVLHALRGRRPSSPVRRRVTWTGFGLVLLGSALIVWGTRSTDAVTLVGGVLALQVGTIALVPRLLTVVARLGAHLPIAPRLVTRDGVRSRLRTVSAVSAITAAMIGATAAVVVTASYANGTAHFYVPRAQPGVALVQYYGDASTATVRDALARAAPSARIGVGSGGAGTESLNSAVQVRHPGCDLRIAGGVAFDATGRGVDLWGPDAVPAACQVESGSSFWWSLVRADQTWLAALTGPLDPAVARALDAGHAVALDPAALGPGGVTLLSYDDQDRPRLVQATTIPAVALRSDVIGPTVVLGPSADPKDWTFQNPIFAVVPPDGADSSEFEAAIRGALEGLSTEPVDPYDPPYALYVERGYVDDARLLALAVVGGTALLALVAALSVTALALSDARPDLATMAAVGAAPGTRRRYAAATGLLVTGTGSTLGILAGLVPAWAISRTVPVYSEYANDQFGQQRTSYASEFFTMPWLPLLLLAVGVPLFTAAVAWLFTRSRIPLTRRAD